VRDDRVQLATRVLSAVIVPFLVLAFAVLYPWPGDTDRLFAWPIKPTFTAMMLGSVYLGGAYFFVRATMARQWHTIKAGFPSVATFATLMGVATLLHWDRFNHDRVAFWLWVALYFTTPFLVLGVWLANRSWEAPATPDQPVVSAPIGRLIGAIGVLAALTSACCFLLPGRMIQVWPWALTPLTARVMGAIFALGIAAIGAFSERRWSAMRLMVEVEVFMLVLILVAAIRAHDEFDTTRPLTWAMGAGLLLVLVGSVGLYLRMSLRPRASGRAQTPIAAPM
jgi:hypothetical protein